MLLQNKEFQLYTNRRRVSTVSDGILQIRPRLTTDIYPDLTNCRVILNELILCEY